MIELVKAREFAKANDGVDAVEVSANYGGSTIYRFIPFAGYENMRTGYPILFSDRGDGFVFLTRDEVDDYLDWVVADVRYEDD